MPAPRDKGGPAVARGAPNQRAREGVGGGRGGGRAKRVPPAHTARTALGTPARRLYCAGGNPFARPPTNPARRFYLYRGGHSLRSAPSVIDLTRPLLADRTFMAILNNEGALALNKGVVPATARGMLYGTLCSRCVLVVFPPVLTRNDHNDNDNDNDNNNS